MLIHEVLRAQDLDSSVASLLRNDMGRFQIAPKGVKGDQKGELEEGDRRLAGPEHAAAAAAEDRLASGANLLEMLGG